MKISYVMTDYLERVSLMPVVLGKDKKDALRKAWMHSTSYPSRVVIVTQDNKMVACYAKGKRRLPLG